MDDSERNPFELRDRRLGALVVAAVVLVGASLARRPEPGPARARVPAGPVFAPPPPPPAAAPPEPRSAAVEDLAAFFTGGRGGACGRAIAADFAADPKLMAALERLRRTGDVPRFVASLGEERRFVAVLRRHAREPGFDAYASALANQPALAPLVAGARRRER